MEELSVDNPFNFYDYIPSSIESLKNVNDNLREILKANDLNIYSNSNNDLTLLLKLMLENPYDFYVSEQKKQIFKNNDLE